MLRTTPDYLQQAVGWFGWFDAPLPVWTYWLVAAFAGPRRARGDGDAPAQRRGVLVACVAAALLVPALVQARSVTQTGIIWQGRYGLFLYLGIIVVAAWLLSGRDALARLLPVRARIPGSAAVSIAAFGLFAFSVRAGCGTSSGSRPSVQMLTAPQWQPPLGWMPLSSAYAIGLARASVALVGVAARRDARREVATAPRGSRSGRRRHESTRRGDRCRA